MTLFLFLVAVLAICSGATIWRAARRTAAIERAFPPEGQFVSVEGCRLHIVVKGEGPDLVLIHGAGGNARDFTYKLVDSLADRYRVFAVDRPGLGWSDQADPAFKAVFTASAASPQRQAHLLANAVAQLGAVNPLVLGHSYGGAVAMAWALEHPTAGLVILSGATMPWPGNLRPFYRVFGSTLGSALAVPLVAAWVPESRVQTSLKGLYAPAPLDPDYLKNAAIPLALRPQTFRSNVRQVKTLRPQLVQMSKHYPSLTLPVEILHGTADTSVRANIHAEPLAACLPNAQLTLLPGIGHAPQHVAPEHVLSAIDRLALRAGLR